MADWAHGYDVSVGYTYGYFREMAPDWLDMCVRLNGFIPPRRGPEGQFRYLDLGTGQGFGLCLLAAANPQGEFLGIDFLPEHIAHAEALADMAGLTNVRFVEADFNDLAATWPDDFGKFDYVVMHGIYSWIPDQVRRSVIACLAHSTRPGALVYNSFNTPPGWQGLTAFQHVTRRLKETTGKTGKAVLDESFGLFDKLIENNASLFKVMPNLKSRIDAVKKQKSAYAIQEYLNESWHPLWHSQVARDMAQVKLDHVGTATIAEVLL
ncbi:MAG: methyltransferase domain-containing protein, partial [Rhizobiaceae bacterium]